MPEPAVEPSPSGLRIRNVAIRRVRVADIQDAPWNFRGHPDEQAAALGGAVDELGFYGYPDVWEPQPGRVQLCDGHLRKSLLLAKYGPDAEIEVNVTDFTEAEARKATATKDSLAAMAEIDADKFDELLEGIDTDSEPLREMLAALAKESGAEQFDEQRVETGKIESVFQVVVECRSERQQKQVYDEMTKKGRKCRLLTV